jgi:hypothetical protein
VTEVCKNGHVRTEANTSWVKESGRAKPRIRCLDCRREAYAAKPRVDPAQRLRERIEDIEDLLRFGATLNEIVERSAYKNWESMREALVKAGRDDLLELLKAKLVQTASVPRRVTVRRKAPCMVRACGRKRYAKGYCNKHWTQNWRTGKPTTKPRRTRRVCSVPDCNEKHKAHGYCNKHRHRLRRHGDPLKITRKEPSV